MLLVKYHLIASLLIVWALAVVRLLPIAILLPNSFAQRATWRWSLLLVIGLAAAVVPTSISELEGPYVNSLPSLLFSPEQALTLLLRETLIGLALGAGFSVLLSGLQVTAGVLAQMTGMRWITSTGVDGGGDEATGLQRFFGLLTLAVLVSSGGYRDVLEAVLESFTRHPAGGTWSQVDVANTISALLMDCFAMGLRAAVPVVFCLLLSTILFSVLARSSSAIGGMGVNLAANALVMLIVTWASVGIVAQAFQDYWTSGVSDLLVRLREFIG